MVTCPYCGNPAELVSGDVIYPHRYDLRERLFYNCAPCDAYVGCHNDTTKPFGRLANAELRQEKMKAHAAFDPIWQSGMMRRGDAYGWLAAQLGIPKRECHIGAFDAPMCQQVIKVCADKFAAIERHLKGEK